MEDLRDALMSRRSRAFIAVGATSAGLAINVTSRLWSFPARDSLTLHTSAISVMILLAIVACAVSASSKKWATAILLAAAVPLQILKIALAYRGHPDDFNHYNLDLAIAYAADILLIWIPATVLTVVWAVTEVKSPGTAVQQRQRGY